MYSNKIPNLTFKKRSGIYSNSTGSLTFDPKTCSAHSYRWWKFVGIVEGQVVFNNFRYSVTTSKQQSKVRQLLRELGIKIDVEMPLPRGINSSDMKELALIAEEHLCDEFLTEESKKIERNAKARARKLKAKLEDYLENQAHFRAYDVLSAKRFGHVNTIAVHQVVESESLERDIENALHNFHRDGFPAIVFYVEGL